MSVQEQQWQDSFSCSFLPRLQRRRRKRAWFPLLAHVLTYLLLEHIFMRRRVQTMSMWSHDLACGIFFCLFPHPHEAARWQQNYHNHTTTSNTLQTFQILEALEAKILPKLVGRWPHTNFTTADHCSGLSITSGVPRHRRVFEGVQSTSLVMYGILYMYIYF